MMPPALLVWSAKGGVGKSMVAGNVAVGLAAAGVGTGLLDADLHGPSAGLLFGLDERLAVRDRRIVPTMAHGVRVVSTALVAAPEHAYVWHGALLRGVFTQLVEDTAWDGCAVLVVDLPPGTGEIQLEALRMLDVAGAVVVTTPHDLALADVRRSLGMLGSRDIPVWAVVENMAEWRCPACAERVTPFGGGAGEKVASQFPGALFLRLPLDGAAASTGTGIPVLARADGPSNDLGRGLSRLVTTVFHRLTPRLSI